MRLTFFAPRSKLRTQPQQHGMARNAATGQQYCVKGEDAANGVLWSGPMEQAGPHGNLAPLYCFREGCDLPVTQLKQSYSNWDSVKRCHLAQSFIKQTQRQQHRLLTVGVDGCH